MPNVDDHGLEVLKKAARNLDPVPKRDYALQTWQVGDTSEGTDPQILNVPVALADTEVEISLPSAYKSFILKSRKICRMKLAFVAGGTSDKWMTVPRGGYWVENKKVSSDKIYIQSDIADNLIEIVAYI